MTENTRTHKKSVSTASASTVMPSHSSPAVRAGTSSGGQALDKHTQATMSARFGHDFSSVRIHTDHRAEESAHAVGANAYAVGNDIVFGGGKYQPGSPETERLLAHELTHVAQQSQLGGGDWGRMSQKGDASEREADSLASQVMMGRSVQVQAMPGAAISRDEEPNASYVYGPPDNGYSGTAPSSNGVSGQVTGDSGGSATVDGIGSDGAKAAWDGVTDVGFDILGHLFSHKTGIGPIGPALGAPFGAKSDRTEEGEKEYEEQQRQWEEEGKKMQEEDEQFQQSVDDTVGRQRDEDTGDMLAHRGY